MVGFVGVWGRVEEGRFMNGSIKSRDAVSELGPATGAEDAPGGVRITAVVDEIWTALVFAFEDDDASGTAGSIDGGFGAVI